MVIEYKLTKLVEQLRGMIIMLNFYYHSNKSLGRSVAVNCQFFKRAGQLIFNIVEILVVGREMFDSFQFYEIFICLCSAEAERKEI